jgi:hypothetical protein
MTDATATALMTRAVTLLSAIRHAHPRSQPAAVRLPCLWAVELLMAEGGVPTVAPCDDASAGIVEALGLLACLPDDGVASDRVLDAAIAARAAYAALG